MTKRSNADLDPFLPEKEGQSFFDLSDNIPHSAMHENRFAPSLESDKKTSNSSKKEENQSLREL